VSLAFYEVGVRKWRCGSRMLSQATESSKYQMWGPYHKRMRSLGEFESIEDANDFLNTLAPVLPEDEVPEDEATPEG